jgi:ABC-type transport system involved in Fe-S cluster assembly fused permease/ATPase subunit
MKKKYIVFGLALILVLPFLVSCSSGISQETYNKVNGDLTNALVQVQKLQGDITSAQAQTQKLQSDLTTAQDKMKLAKSKIEIINAIFLPALKGEFDNMTEAQILNLFFGWRDKVVGIGDAALTAKFQAIIDSNGGDAETLAFFLYLFESLPKTLD